MTLNKDKVIDDLLKKDPRGSYSHSDIFGLEFFSKHEVESYISKRFYDSYKFSLTPRRSAVVTRRAQRVWDRIGPIVSKMQEQGGPGIYKVTERWSYGVPEMGYIFANSIPEAVQLAKTLFSFLVKDPEMLCTTYMYESGPERLDELVPDVRERYKRLEAEASKELVAVKEKLKKAENMLVYLENFGSAMFS